MPSEWKAVKMLFGSNQINTGDTVYLRTKTVARLAVKTKGDNLALIFAITMVLPMVMAIKNHKDFGGFELSMGIGKILNFVFEQALD